MLLNRFRSDESLMLAYQRGDSRAFESLYHRHKDGLFAFLFRGCQQRAMVEELAQDTWMAVIRAAPEYQPTAAFRTWLYRIARNRLADAWRRDRQELSMEDAPQALCAAPPPDREDEAMALMDAIGRLPLEQRDTLLLQQQGFSLEELADITGAGAETVKSRLRYARNQLRASMGGDL